MTIVISGRTAIAGSAVSAGAKIPHPRDRLFVCRAELDRRRGNSGLNVDFDAQGNVMGFGIDRASQKLELSTLENRGIACEGDKGGLARPCHGRFAIQLGERFPGATRDDKSIRQHGIGDVA
jgi:uncharacterized protein YuzE